MRRSRTLRPLWVSCGPDAAPKNVRLLPFSGPKITSDNGAFSEEFAAPHDNK